MRIEFDPIKDAANQRKHGRSLSMVVHLDWERAWMWPDLRQDYGETRFIALVPAGPRLYCIVLVFREDAHRIISARRANRREYRRHEQYEKANPAENAD